MALKVYEVPLRPQPEAFGITLAGKDYRLTVRWREATEGGWVLDIATSAGDPILMGVPLVTGADLLAQYPHLAFGGSLIVQTDHNPDAVPTFANLGQLSHLYFVVKA